MEDSIAAALAFITKHDRWIIEGCYADIIERVLVHCDELVFLNPGVEACMAHCRSRPWEPEKFGSKEEQDGNLENLLAWVASYETRDDEYGLRRHKALFEAFGGKKREITKPDEYG